MEKCLAFDIWGNYGHFRKFYTTSSPLTHAFPPKTAIWGMIGAIIGLDKDEYLYHFQDPRIFCGIKIISPVIKTRMATNLIDTKGKNFRNSKKHTRVNMEILKRPKYRIYFSHPDEAIYKKLKESLSLHRSYYTLCLGLSEYLAQYRFLGEYPMYNAQGYDGVVINSVIPMDKIKEYKFEDGYEYFKETLPAGMNPQRQPTEYHKVLYERNGEGIRCIPIEYYKVGVETVENIIPL